MYFSCAGWRGQVFNSVAGYTMTSDQIVRIIHVIVLIRIYHMY